tara:strand:+ start:377 stop:943 length:567 start_codon:yes stop_codon:yes gene_type:complete
MISKINTLKTMKLLTFLGFITFFLSGCNGKIPGADARKFPADPKKRVEQNLAEGRGFTLQKTFGNSGGTFEFASSNELWRASLDIISFMPLSSVNYSGGIIITDWYFDEKNPNESIKISIRFLTNEVRSDALDIKVFKKKCFNDLMNCKISQKQNSLNDELKKEILKKATIYKNQEIEKNKKTRKKSN